jgi:hypothetical protein
MNERANAPLLPATKTLLQAPTLRVCAWTNHLRPAHSHGHTSPPHKEVRPLVVPQFRLSFHFTHAEPSGLRMYVASPCHPAARGGCNAPARPAAMPAPVFAAATCGCTLYLLEGYVFNTHLPAVLTTISYVQSPPRSNSAATSGFNDDAWTKQTELNQVCYSDVPHPRACFIRATPWCASQAPSAPSTPTPPRPARTPSAPVTQTTASTGASTNGGPAVKGDTPV